MIPNAAALLALMGDLYEQVAVLQARNAQLEQALAPTPAPSPRPSP